MRGLRVFKFYIKLKLHFDSESNFDYITNNFNIRITQESLDKRNDKGFFYRIGNLYKEDTAEFMLSNFANNIGWIGNMKKKPYLHRKKYIESLTYMFNNDILKIMDHVDNINDSFIINNDESHPLFLRMFLGEKISIETMVVADKIFGYTTLFDKTIKDNFWKRLSYRIKAYDPFITIDIDKIKNKLRAEGIEFLSGS